MSNNPTTPVDELTAKIRFVLDKYYISNPLPPDDADIDMSITDLALLFETYKLPSIHMNDVNGIDCPACGHPTLMLMSGNYITCCMADCPNPDYSDALDKFIQTRERTAHIDELKNVRHPSSSDGRWDDWKESRLQQLQPKPQAGEGGEG